MPEGELGEAVIRRYLPSHPWEVALLPFTADDKLVADYARLSLPEVEALPFPRYLLYRRDALLHLLRQSEAGCNTLEAMWRLSRHSGTGFSQITEEPKLLLHRKE